MSRVKLTKYETAIEWIALNDEPEDQDREAITGYISVHLTAAIFDRTADRVAQDVLTYREKYEADGGI